MIVNAGWVLVDRSDRGDYRSRLVAQELNLGAALGFDTFAATPSTATVRLVMACALKAQLAFGARRRECGLPPRSYRRQAILREAASLRMSPGLLVEVEARDVRATRESEAVAAALGHVAHPRRIRATSRTRAAVSTQSSGALAVIFADDILITAPEEWLERTKKNIEKELTINWGRVIDTSGRSTSVSFRIDPQGSVCTNCRTGCRVSARIDCLCTRHRRE